MQNSTGRTNCLLFGTQVGRRSASEHIDSTCSEGSSNDAEQHEEMETHLARTERRRREMEDTALDDEDPGFGDDEAAAKRARQFDLVKELLTAPALGTS